MITKNTFSLTVLVIALLTAPYITRASDQVSAQDIPQTLTAGDVHEVKITSTAVGTEQTFIISAYYSPIKGQAKYVTGSYAGDIRLNGGGVHGADGTPVYPGMIAAPKSYLFGTKMKIPGIGTVAVHDRGGAIVHSGERGNAYDRLDVWMGYGDAGLKRALSWGKRTVNVINYGVNPDIKEEVTLTGYSESEKIAVTNTLTFNSPGVEQKATLATVNTVSFGQTLAFGTVHKDVAKIQSILKNLNYYNGEVNSIYDEKTVEAVTKFQVNEKIVATSNSYGAGYLGPKTLKVLASKLNIAQAHAAEDSFFPKSALNSDLHPGDMGDEVRRLQEELYKLNLLALSPTGKYGDVTKHAVFKFQQIHQLAGEENAVNSGIFGPKTRTAMNLIIAEREKINNLKKNI
jgi:peptidoglycan hydrolase-like protein with peptidoglycan-binding domain/3D (Asp-Asp-Asp) domain-containing protein